MLYLILQFITNKSQPDSWEDKIVEANIKHMDPPLSNSEVQQLIKSVNRKGYDKYRCKDAPINSVCQSGLCRTKRFGVGFGEEEMPVTRKSYKIYFKSTTMVFRCR